VACHLSGVPAGRDEQTSAVRGEMSHPPQPLAPRTARRIDSADSGALSRSLQLALARLGECYCKAWIDHATTLAQGRRCDKTFSVI
jgi:hypothetical protein